MSTMVLLLAQVLLVDISTKGRVRFGALCATTSTTNLRCRFVPYGTQGILENCRFSPPSVSECQRTGWSCSCRDCHRESSSLSEGKPLSAREHATAELTRKHTGIRGLNTKKISCNNPSPPTMVSIGASLGNPQPPQQSGEPKSAVHPGLASAGVYALPDVVDEKHRTQKVLWNVSMPFWCIFPKAGLVVCTVISPSAGNVSH